MYVGIDDETQEIIVVAKAADDLLSLPSVETVWPATDELYGQIRAGKNGKWVLRDIDGIKTADLE